MQKRIDEHTDEKFVGKRKHKATKDNDMDSEEEFEEDDDMEEEIDFTAKCDPSKDPNMDEEEKEGDWEDATVDFEFYDPNPNQFFSVKNLINGYLDGFSFKSSELAEIICNQAVVGTMIGCEEDENEKGKVQDKNVFAFATILNMNRYEKISVMKEIVSFVVGKSKTHNENHEAFIQTLTTSAHKIGLLVNERIINLPPKCVPVLHNQVVEDLKWVMEQNDEEERMYFNLDYLLCVTKVFKNIEVKSKKVKGALNLEEYVYQKFEDNKFAEAADYVYVFEAKTSKTNAGLTNLEPEELSVQCYRMVYLITLNNYKRVVAELDQLIEQYSGGIY
eukprot:TRINITY_DN2397_c0_g2_i1.p1 TRINITY_DN2397_c0_g2~~TRINITY_DN2397_c0_g2_i1.p1  ORF type:complete len:333 (+),score=72.94 TRINITY_DN2397_c0_g2_i1:106-1104(+)